MLTVRRLADHAWAVVTTHRLLVLEEDRTVLDRPWAEVDRATMDSDTEELTVTWVDGSPPDVLLVGEDPGVSDFTFAVKERVDNSLVHLELELRGAIRRNPDGSLFSQVSVSGARRAPADLEERAAALEARVRSVVGLTP